MADIASLIKALKDKAVAQYDKGAPYRQALASALKGDTQGINRALSKSDLTPMDFALMMGVNPIKGATIYHGTTPEAAKAIEKHGFDITKSADGSIWFTSDPNIGEVAATGQGGIVKRILPNNLKLGSYDEGDKYFIDELINQGYHGMQYPGAPGEATHYQIFNPEMLKK